jgi:large subunit ribosomal protein L18
MSKENAKWSLRRKRSRRVRYRIAGTGDRLRLSVFRSNKNIFAQIIDDRRGITVASASTLDKELRKKGGSPFNKETAREVGRRIAERAKKNNVERVVFDRGQYLYHGKVKALAEGAREGGLDF